MLSKPYQALTFPSFLCTKEKSNFLAEVICHPLSFLCSAARLYLCSFFSLSPFGGMFIFQSLYLGITNKPYSFFFFSHNQAAHPKHFKILLFLPVPILKSCHFLLVPEAKKHFPNIFICSNVVSSAAQNLFCS